MRVGSLFSGIGGIDLGLQRAGMEIVWQVENDDWCRKVLARHFPDAVRYGDVRDCRGEVVGNTPSQRSPAECEPSESAGDEEAGWRESHTSGRLSSVDLICGGFPCQPVSHTGRRLGAEDERWLWPEFMRIIREVRPRWVLVENVPGLLSIDDGRLFGGVLRDLAEGGYDAEWDHIPAAALGAPHIRDRVFLIAYADSGGGHGRGVSALGSPEGRGAFTEAPRRGGQWATEPDVGRVAHGVPARVDRLRGLGNAVVPQVAEYIGRLIMEVGP
jgi:DNA (cytosine-5)-methyltransferase 1